MSLTYSQLQRFIAEICDAPEPMAIGAGADLHHEVAAIRYQGAREVCASFLKMARAQFGDEAAENYRLSLAPIRKQLAGTFPEYAERLADPAWPDVRIH